jgi:hypothetical protein
MSRQDKTTEATLRISDISTDRFPSIARTRHMVATCTRVPRHCRSDRQLRIHRNGSECRRPLGVDAHELDRLRLWRAVRRITRSRRREYSNAPASALNRRDFI